jgi:YidC/Oxa1 family membrane protein insertase
MELMQPKSDDPAQQQSNAILKFLPLLIGWFSLNVPSALCVYWVVNNVVTTATSLFIRNSVGKVTLVTPGTSGSASMPPPPPTIFAPPREKPAGFGESIQQMVIKDGVQPITPIDAIIVENEDDEQDTEDSNTESKSSSKRRGSSKKKKSKSKS